ncbi:MAG: RNA-binding S4 domain-containing protein [Flavobacteriales bacterium]|nr:RNA-binding S4 domain-containing protein [Flavobacteriales bacterium]MDG1765306.1 RNA-binding S4 domain-containing protein [Flavobacteriales bacterium]
MRVDKYLWAIRVYKTRSLASSQVKENKVKVNEEVVKPARSVKVGDIIELRKGAVHFTYKVTGLPNSRVGAKLVEEYSKNLTPQEELDKLEMMRLQRVERPHGTGRPTKQERRDWEKFFENDIDDETDFS